MRVSRLVRFCSLTLLAAIGGLTLPPPLAGTVLDRLPVDGIGGTRVGGAPIRLEDALGVKSRRSSALADQLSDALAKTIAELRDVRPAPRLDAVVLTAMVAALPRHSAPLTASTADGHTFSGLNRTTKSGAVTFFEEVPFVIPVPFPGINLHIISWDIVQQQSSFNCDFTNPLTVTTETLQNHYTIDYSIDASGTPGEINAINVVIPSFRNNEPGTTIAWPIDQLSVSATVTTSAGTQSGTGTVATPPPGAAANYLIQLVSPLDVGDGSVQIAVDLDGEVQPPLANPTTTNDPSCPGLGIFAASGRSQLLLDNTFVTIFIEQAATSALEITPTSSTIDLTETQSFNAFDCPKDANGNPDAGPDGVPGTSDDLCTPATNASWSVTGSIGSVDQATGPTTTLTPALPTGSASETGQVLVTDGNSSAAADVTVNLPLFLTVFPATATIDPNETQTFDAWNCPRDANGNPDAGPDGVPGTSDDLCTPAANATWSKTGPIGTLSNPSGPSTTLTAAAVAPGETASGSVIAATASGQTDGAAVTVVGPGTETHQINLEVERMFRQGLPFADDSTAGDTQVVVRPTTAHELNESLDTMPVGGTIIPFDAGASLTGELVTCERTIVAVSPADLGAMRQAILDDIEASGRDSSNPRRVASFLRHHPDRGRVTLTLDAGVDRSLSTDAGAYAGSVDAGFIDFRADLLLRAAQAERVIRVSGSDRRIGIVVNLVENDAVTNVIPFSDWTSNHDARRFHRDPSDGGIFQGFGAPHAAQLIAVNDGGRDDEGRTNTRGYATVSSANVGETGDRNAHAVAHMVGHLLFGRSHNRRSTLFIMRDDPARGGDDSFFTDNFTDFHYDDRTVRRGARHLDRHWRTE